MIALVRTEFTKAARRTRTLIIAALLAVLPIILAVAVSTTSEHASGDNSGAILFHLARQSGLLFPAAVLTMLGGFLLVVVAGIFAGDSVAGDASWGNLRYLLMRPVPRGRLLIAKALVAGALIWAMTALVTAAALLAGIAAFGTSAVSGPGFHLSSGALVVRVVIATAYMAFGFTALLAIGTFLSTLTDSTAGAVAATVGVYIVFEILDSVSALGQVRYGFPTHYLNSWTSMFTANTFSSDMITGAVVQVIYLVVFGAAAIHWFGRKDIAS